MKKLLLLFAVLLGTVEAWAQLVKTSTAESPIYYVIASYNRGGVINYANVGEAVQHTNYNDNSLWYFEAVADNENNGVYIVNKSKSGEDKVYLGSDKKASTTPAVWYVLENGVNKEGFSISSTNPISGSSCIDANNSNTGVGSWNPSASDWHGTTWVFFEVGNKVYNPNNYVAQQGTPNRAITSITINSVTQSFSTYGLAYADHTSRVEFKVAAGGEVAISIGRTGNWMHSYAYVDEDADGFTIEDAVTYSYLSSTRANSAGVANGDNTVEMPSFTAPVTAGEYRLRVKYDWDDLDPNGGAQFATAGSQFVDVTLIVVNNPLTPIIPLAEALYNSTKDNTGTAIGEYPAEKVEALATAIEKAKAISDDAATDDDVLALQTAMDAVKANLPTAGQYYQIHSSLAAFSEVKAVYSNGSQLAWKSLNADDKSFYWKAVATPDGGVVFQNAADNKYMVGSADQSGAWTVADEYTDASKASFKIFSKAENEKGYEYGVVLNNWQMHCAGHSNGAGNASNIVSWNTDQANSASAWYVVPVELKEFFDVTYNFIYNDEVKYTSTVSIASGAEYPEVMVPVMPYGINAGEVARPEGTVTENKVVNFELTKEKEFTSVKTVVDAANIDTWYYVQMHANGSVTSYIEDNGGSTVEWTDKTVAQADIESHLWGFVGDVFGMKMVNKKTGKAIASTGSGSASMSDVNSATSFVVTASQANDPWFCFKYPTNNNYLNAQGDCIKHWAANDNGSSFKATEYKIHEVEVGTADYATLYLGSKVFIPETVEAYVVSEATGNYASLTQVTGSLPANTGVILKGEGTHQFITSADAATTIESNLLAGSVENTYVAGPAYVLANGTNGVGLYKATLNKDAEGAVGTTHFLNNAFKAYLPANAVTTADARFLVFDFGGTETAIEGIEAESTANAVVYDLAGRRVQKAQKGLYIVNGKKVIK